MTDILKQLDEDMKNGKWPVMMYKDSDEESWVYESPDGGKTVYRRRFGQIKDRELIKSPKMSEDAVTRLADRISYMLLATNKHDDYEWLKQVLRDATVV